MGFSARLNQLYSAYPIQIGALIGALLGLFVISPIAMVLEHITHTSMEDLWEHIVELFRFENPAWTLFFTVLGALIGMVFGSIERRFHRLQRSLLQAEKLASIGQLAAGVAHEINTPLANIAINVETARMKSQEPEVIAKLDLISNQVDRASQIVKDLLEYSSPSTPERIEVDINEVLKRAVGFVEGVRMEDVRVEERYWEDLPMVLGEPNQLLHAFSNVLNNAYDAMPDGGVLEITTEVTQKGCVVVLFRDTGMGIPKDELPRVFDPFYTTKAPGKGTGLGLSISQSIIRKHRGNIQVSSVEGEGTTVRVLVRGMFHVG